MKLRNRMYWRVCLVILVLLLGATLAACGKKAPQSASQDVPTPVSDTPTVSPLATVASQELVAVSPLSTPVSPLPTVVIDPSLPEPSKGTATVAGELYSFVFHKPIPGTVFYFTPAQGANKDEPPIAFFGAREEYGDVSGLSDEEGRFVIEDMPPGKYFLAVWAPYSWILAVEQEQSRVPRLFIIEPDQRLNFGRLFFDWPNG